MKIRAKATGWTVVAAAAALFVAGCTAPGGSGSGEVAEVQCHGVNACAGHGACAGANNSCAGQNSCKGQDWVSMPAGSCEAMGGTIG